MVTQARNWDWTTDELILALDFYLTHDSLPRSGDDTEIVALSEFIRSLPIIPLAARPGNFRNPTGVYFKLLNLHYVVTGGASGLSNIATADRAIWEQFKDDQAHLHRLARAIRRIAMAGLDEMPDNQDDLVAPEGLLLMRMHRLRERNSSVVQKRKSTELQKHGTLRCEACGFDFKETYGTLGDTFIECHHIKPLAELDAATQTRLSDLALVCSNCHRMLHRSTTVRTIPQLRDVLSHFRQT